MNELSASSASLPVGSQSLSYSSAGVEEQREQAAFLQVMRPWLMKTSISSPYVSSLSGIGAGHFATVLRFNTGTTIALTTDGVGTKILVARMARRYDTVGIDCVANNVNDLICLGADPLALLDYIAIDRIDEEVLEQIAHGLSVGANAAGIAIPGGEIAQVGELLAPGDEHGPVFDLVGTAIGGFPTEGDEGGPRGVLDGSGVTAGDVILGLPSSGLHSNGYTLARRVLLDHAALSLEDAVPGSSLTVGDALLEATTIYVDAVRSLWEAGVAMHGLINVSGGGLLNLGRLPADVSYRIESLPQASPIFRLIQEAGTVSVPEMYTTFNMGVGFCIVAPESAASDAMEALASHGGFALGSVSGESGRIVHIPPLGLSGRGDEFGGTEK